MLMQRLSKIYSRPLGAGLACLRYQERIALDRRPFVTGVTVSTPQRIDVIVEVDTSFIERSAAVVDKYILSALAVVGTRHLTHLIVQSDLAEQPLIEFRRDTFKHRVQVRHYD